MQPETTMVSTNLLRIYALAVCFVSVIVFSVSTGIGVYDVVQVNLPETTLSGWQYERYQSNANFIRDWPPEKTLPDDDALTRMREQSYRIAIAVEARDAKQSLIQQAITMLIMVALFFIHWKLSRKTLQSS